MLLLCPAAIGAATLELEAVTGGDVGNCLW